MTIAISGTSGITQTGSFDSSSTFGFKNRLINSAMVIDQRNAGASVTQNNTGTQYCLDRYYIFGNQNSKFTVQQNAGSVTLPAGFSNYLGATSSSAYSVPSTEIYTIAQAIEGFNTADLAWGTASASSVTLSFWVRSSLTGTFGGAILNSAQNYSYPFSYTISSANTWTQISVTIAGPTAGTWIGATNGIGLRIVFSLGSGTSASGTSGSWSANGYYSATGATSVVGTNGATFYITGVQLEKGSTATSFDYRPYGTELALCQRYYYQTPTYANSTQLWDMVGMVADTTHTQVRIPLPVPMRTTPSVALNPAYNTGSGWQINLSSINNYALSSAPSVLSYAYSSVVVISCAHSAVATTSYCLQGELFIVTGVATNNIQVSAEL